MTARVDSIQKLDELDAQRRMRGEMPTVSIAKSTPESSQIAFILYLNTQRYVSALNQAAWVFQERSLEYREDGSLFDTYAPILYRLGRKQEAVEWQQKAVQKERTRNSPLVNSLEATLRKIQQGIL